MKFLKHVLPCFVALMVCLSAFICFAAPVSAAVYSDMCGSWVPISDADWSVDNFKSFVDGAYGFNVSGSVSGVTFTDGQITYSSTSNGTYTVLHHVFYYTLDGERQYIYDLFYDSETQTSGASVPDGVLVITDFDSTNYDTFLRFYSWWITHFQLVGFDISIYEDTTSLFSHTSASAPTSLSVTAAGGSFTFADGSTQSFTYSGSVPFPGFSGSKFGPATYLPGNTYDLTGKGDITLYTGDFPPLPPLTEVIASLDLSGVLDEVISLLPVTMPVFISFAAIRKGLSFVRLLLQSA